MRITLTIEGLNEKEARRVLSQIAEQGSDKDLGADVTVKEAGYTPSSDRTRLALDALNKCQRIRLAKAGEKLEAWALSYPSVDLAYWITKQDAWAVSSDTKWSTKGWARHLNWRLCKSQDELKGSLGVQTNVRIPTTPVPVDPAVKDWAAQ